MAKMNLNEEIGKIKKMMGILSEAYRDDYKQSAPRARSIAKIANSMRYKQTTPNKKKSFDDIEQDDDTKKMNEPEQINYDEYFPKVDEFFDAFEKYERDIENDGIKISETYYHNDMYVFMKVTEYDGVKDSELNINMKKFIELRKLLGVNEKMLIAILRNRYDVVNVMKYNPPETMADIRRFKQPVKSKPTTPELPYDEIMNYFIEKYNLKSIEFYVTEKNRNNKTKTIDVKYEIYYTPDLEIQFYIKKYDDEIGDYLKIYDVVYVEIVNYVKERYQKLDYNSVNLFFEKLFNVKGFGYYYNLEDSNYVKLRDKMRKEIKNKSF